MTANTLSNQRRIIEKTVLTQAEMKAIKESIEGTAEIETEVQQETEVRTEDVEETIELTEEMICMKEELIVRFNYIKNIKLIEREPPLLPFGNLI